MNHSSTKKAIQLAKESVRASQERLEVLIAEMRSHQEDEAATQYNEPMNRATELTSQLLELLNSYSQSAE